MATVTISGVETTQGIQTFQSTFPVCGSAAMKTACPDNAVPLVAGKPTALRVYISGGTPAGRVTAQALLVNNTPITNGYTPQVTVLGVTSIDTPAAPGSRRLESRETLNFLLPAHMAFGSHTLIVTAYDSSTNAGSPPPFSSYSMKLDFVVRGLIRLRLARIRYTGRGMRIDPPSMNDFWASIAGAEPLYPAPTHCVQVLRESVEEYDGDFTAIHPVSEQDNPGNWGTTGSILHILDELARLEDWTGSGSILFIAIYNDRPGVKQSTFVGYMVNGRAIVNADPFVVAHEIGHWLRRGHVNCGNPANPDVAYPSYGTHPQGSIGEVGFDPMTSTVKNPATTFDVMSYCHPRWISPYGFGFAYGYNAPQPRIPPTRVALDSVLMGLPGVPRLNWHRPRLPPPSPVPPENMLVFDIERRSGRIDAKFPAFIHKSAPRLLEGGEIEAELLDSAGEVLSRNSFELLPECTADNSVPLAAVTVRIPWHEAAARIVIRSGQTTWLDRAIEPQAPAFTAGFSIVGDPVAEIVRVNWTVESKVTVAVRLRFSSDGGQTWQAIRLPQTASRHDVVLSQLSGGSDCLLELLASSGVRTASVRSPVFRSIGKPTLPLIVSPPDNAVLVASEPLILYGLSTRDGADHAELTWHSDQDGLIGVGPRFRVETLSPGLHVIELRDGDHTGRTSRATVTVCAEPTPPDRRCEQQS